MIVDASVAFKWFAVEEDSDLAMALLAGTSLVAPGLLAVEIANGLWKKAMKEQIDIAVSFSPELDQLGELVTLVDERGVVGRALEIARTLRHAVYDCIYLALAESLNDTVVSADKKLLGKLLGGEFAHLVTPLDQAVP